MNLGPQEMEGTFKSTEQWRPHVRAIIVKSPNLITPKLIILQLQWSPNFAFIENGLVRVANVPNISIVKSVINTSLK